MSYKDEITGIIKDNVNNWIGLLKEKHQELCLTHQWKLVHDNGFVPGYITVPVVTSSGNGPHLVGEVGFHVSDDLEIDLDELEFIQKDEPYVRSEAIVTTQPISQPLDLINEILVGLSDFIVGMTHSENQRVVKGPGLPPVQAAQKSPIKIHQQATPNGDLEEIILQLKHRTVLPSWFRAIGSNEVQDTLFRKIAESYVHYQKQSGQHILLKDFLKRYEEYLKQEGKLYTNCTYKAKPVDVDKKGLCQESYCSKKPFQKPCENIGLKFGQI